MKPCTADPARKAAASGAAASGLLRYPLGAPDMERLECFIDAKASISVPWRSCSATPRSSARTPPSVIARLTAAWEANTPGVCSIGRRSLPGLNN